MSFTTYIIANIHEVALPIPDDDRRFFVASNGEPQDEAFWQEIRDWMDAPANVAAFYNWLAEVVDISDFNPFAPPPRTSAKDAMVEAAQSDLDRALTEALDGLNSKVLVLEQLVPMVERVARENGYDLPQAPGDKRTVTIKRAAQKLLYRVGERGSANERLMIEGKRYYVWATTQRDATLYSNGDQELLRRDVLRNGHPPGASQASGARILPIPRPKKVGTAYTLVGSGACRLPTRRSLPTRCLHDFGL